MPNLARRAPRIFDRGIGTVWLIVLAFMGLVACGGDPQPDEGSAPDRDGEQASQSEQRASSDIEASRPTRRALAEPTKLEIPAIDLDKSLVEVGYNPDQSMEVPDYGEAAWFNGQPKPGQRGAAVISAHLDSTSGPDVFFRLDELGPGDEIVVERDDDTPATFVVDRVNSYDQEEFPHELVYGHTSQPTLRLITCDGLYDGSHGGYQSNLVVFATLADG